MPGPGPGPRPGPETTIVRPIVHSIVRTAVDATGAARGWLVRVDGERLRVVAAYPAPPGEPPLVGVQVPLRDGVAGYVASSGQPLALRPSGAGTSYSGGVEAQIDPTPASVACVPCEHDGAVLGALQLVDAPRGSFSYDDVEVLTLLGGIAGAALAEAGVPLVVPHPTQLGTALAELARDDPDRYARVAPIVEALLTDG